jgi:transcriptional antiterminator NusG
MDTQNARWYVLFTSTGYEQLVKTTIEKKVENNNLQSVVLDVKIPMEETIEVKTVNGKETSKVVQHKLFPCYVFIKMVYSNAIWYNVLKGTAGLQGFASGSAMPLTEEEVKKMRLEEKVADSDLQVGQEVKIISGALDGFAGVIEELNNDAQKAKVKVSMFGRDTVVEVTYVQIEKLN